MRLWTLHPRYLDGKGLVALWREGLLAKAVLEGKTCGYRNHPQLNRFRAHHDPHGFLCEYLREVLIEAGRRGYHFDAAKLPVQEQEMQQVEETQGQLDYEWQHLLQKIKLRDREHYTKLIHVKVPDSHPVFQIVAGGIQNWEKTMNKNIDPKIFGLHSGTILEQVGPETIAIVVKRKSRIIMADGRKILAKAAKIKETRSAFIILKTSAPVCSKTAKFLEEQGIEVLPLAG